MNTSMMMVPAMSRFLPVPKPRGGHVIISTPSSLDGCEPSERSRRSLAPAPCPSRPASSRHACRPRRRSRPPATRGCTRSSTTVSAWSHARTATASSLYSRPGNDLTYRFTLIVEALARLRSRSCIIDGEAVCCDDKVRRSFISGWTEIRCLGLRIWCDLAAL